MGGYNAIMLTITLNIDDNTVYETVITHNAALLFDDIGVYDALYHSQGKQAGSIISILQLGINKLDAGKRKYTIQYMTGADYNYQGIVAFLGDLLMSCQEYPESVIGVDTE